MTTTLKNKIREMARESVREVIREELTRLRVLHMPPVSKKEQQNIEKLYKKPSGRAVRTIRMRT